MDAELPHEVVPYTPFTGASFMIAVDQEPDQVPARVVDWLVQTVAQEPEQATRSAGHSDRGG